MPTLKNTFEKNMMFSLFSIKGFWKFIIRLWIFMQIYIFTNTRKEIESKQRFVSPIKHYNERSFE